MIAQSTFLRQRIERTVISERTVAAMPADVRFDEAVVCEGAFYANAVLKRINLEPGQTIIIYGARGAIGTALVQLAKSSGAVVTAVVATRHLELLKSLGADHAIDYTSRDFARIGETFDFVVDAVGKTSFFRCRKLLKRDGVFAATDLGPWGQNALLTIWSSITRNNRVVIPLPGRIAGFVGYLKGLMEAGQFTGVIDRHYDLAPIADAYRYVETGQKVGIVVINVGRSIKAETDRPPKRLHVFDRLSDGRELPLRLSLWRGGAHALRASIETEMVMYIGLGTLLLIVLAIWFFRRA